MELEWPASEMVRKSTVFRSCGDIVEMRAPGQEEPKRWTSCMGTGYSLTKSPRVGFGRTISLEHPANSLLVGGMADGRRTGRDQTVCYQRLQLMISDKNSRYRRVGIDGVHDARELEEPQHSGDGKRAAVYSGSKKTRNSFYMVKHPSSLSRAFSAARTAASSSLSSCASTIEMLAG